MFNRFAEGDTPTYQAWKAAFGHLLQPQACCLPPITGAHIKARLKSLASRGAPGADSWTVPEAAALPESLLDLVADLFMAIERGGDWPPALLFGLVPLLPKGGGRRDGLGRPAQAETRNHLAPLLQMLRISALQTDATLAKQVDPPITARGSPQRGDFRDLDGDRIGNRTRTIGWHEFIRDNT